MIYERAYAKINLALEVKDIENGYHLLNNYMVPIDLADEVILSKSADLTLECQQDIKDNSCLKAAEIFLKHFEIKESVRIVLKKIIPLQAGLAGGSSDAAATLRGLRRLFNTPATLAELEPLAAQIGSDVPFFLYNQGALCTGRGEKVAVKDYKWSFDVLLIKPQFGLSTKEVYANYKTENQDKDLSALYQALDSRNIKKLDQAIFNDLEKTALALNSKLNELFSKLKAADFKPHLSGSGSTVFLVDFEEKDLEKIKEICQAVLDERPEIYICRTI